MLMQWIHRYRALGVLGLLAAAVAVPVGCSEAPEQRVGGSENSGSVESAGGGERSPLPQPAAERMAALLDAYFQVGDTLADDTAEGIETNARRMAESAEGLAEVDADGASDLGEHEQEIQTIQQQAETLAGTEDVEAARSAYGELSDALERLVRAVGVPESYGAEVHGFVCGMAEGVPRDGVWLQANDEPRNPYMGSRMPACHSQEFAMPTAGGTGGTGS